MNKKIVLDCLGGDNSEEELALGTLNCLHYGVDFVLVGEEKKLRKALEEAGADLSRYEFIDCSKWVSNREDPRFLIKEGEDVSIVKAMLRLNEDDAFAYIGAGSTGAVLLASIFRLGLIEGIRFPALGCFIFSYKGERVCLLDCGANLDMAPALSPKFAALGAIVTSAYQGIKNPRIGLLNVGGEEGKGNAFAKASYPLLKESGLNFIGNIEGSDIILGKADVVLTDGFAGNVALKAIESTAMACKQIALNNGDAKGAEEIDSLFHFTTRGASMVFGAKKIVLKPHGSADRFSIEASIEMAVKMEQGHVLEALSSGVRS